MSLSIMIRLSVLFRTFKNLLNLAKQRIGNRKSYVKEKNQDKRNQTNAKVW